MPFACFESERPLRDPFYIIRAQYIEQDSGRVARSNLELFVDETFTNQAVKERPRQVPEEYTGTIFFAVQSATRIATKDPAFCKEEMILCNTPIHTGEEYYLTQETARKYFPKAVDEILNDDNWVQRLAYARAGNSVQYLKVTNWAKGLTLKDGPPIQ